MIKKTIFIIFLICCQGYEFAASSYLHLTRDEEISFLKAKLGHLYAEKVMLQKNFQLNTQEKRGLFTSLCVVSSLGFFGEILGLITKRTSCYLESGYIGIILFYYWLKVLQYISLTGDIKTLEEEIENLQLLPVE